MKVEMDGEEEVSHGEACIGKLCFQAPYSTYKPPPFYPRLSHKNHKWKVEAMLRTGLVSHLKIGRACVLPNCLGLGDDGRWRWRWLPVSVLVGLSTESYLENKDDGSYSVSTCLSPYVRLKSLTPVLGKLALQPLLELSTVSGAEIRREFSVGQSKFAVRASIKAGNSVTSLTECLRWAIQLHWNTAATDALQSKLENDVLTLEYLRRWTISQSCKLVASAAIRTPLLSSQRSFCGSMNFGSVKVAQKLGSWISRDKPLPTSAYLRASEKFGRSNTITIAPGHWIDPGVEYGAPGERGFNLEIANLVERNLHAHGWKVLRPDRDAPYLSWEEYLNWVSKQTRNGHPVVEIHGQGHTADFRGLVFGIIGDPKTSLNRELAKDFGIFEMDWKELGVPRRGGVIVESFNSDDVLQMAPWQRSQAARRITNQFVGCIERARSRIHAEETEKSC